MTPVHAIHISDSHVPSDEVNGRAAQRLAAVVARIQQLSDDGVPVDFVVHTGDLMDDADLVDDAGAGTGETWRRLAHLSMPWFLLGGNHDRQEWLQDAAVQSAVGDCLSAEYGGKSSGVLTRQAGELRLIFVNANPERGVRQGPAYAAEDVRGIISAEQCAAVQRLLVQMKGDTTGMAATASTMQRAALFIHYPPLEQEASWSHAPAGGEALHRVLAEHAPRVAGVFTGHIHRSQSHWRDGILYSSAPAIASQFLLWPDQQEHAVVDDDIVGFNYLSFDARGTRVQHHCFQVCREHASLPYGPDNVGNSHPQ